MDRGISLAIGKFAKSWYENCNQEPSLHIKSILTNISHCRTEAMGGRKMFCENCNTTHIVWNSCGNRHCPNCHSTHRQSWLLSRKEELINATYFHVVFTLPAVLNNDILSNKQEGYSALFEAAKETIKEFGEKQGLQMGVTAILHTWGSNLSFHPHLHCIVPGGGWSLEENCWKSLPQINDEEKKPFLFPVKALSTMFRAKWMALFTEKVQIDKKIREECFAKPWVVYAKSPVSGAEKTLEYLARYAFGIAIGNKRITDIDDVNVTFEYKDYRNGGQNRTMILKGEEFIRRYVQHILPKRFVRIRHFGFLAPINREKLAAIQNQLCCKPVAKQRKRKTWDEVCMLSGITPWLCKKCKKGILKQIELVPRNRSPVNIWYEAI